MERNIKREAIVLKRLPIGESNIGLTLLTDTDDVLFVMAFGAAKPKSKLFEGTTPFVLGTFDLYYDPVKEHWRAKDFSATEYNTELHSEITSFYFASFIAEVALKSGGSEGNYNLIRKTLEILKCNNHKLVLIQFLLRFLYNQGILPDFTSCSSCYRNAEGESLFFTGSDHILCRNCYHGGKSIELTPGIRAYIIKTLGMDYENSIKVGLSEISLGFLKEYLIIQIKNHVGGKLLTLETCEGII